MMRRAAATMAILLLAMLLAMGPAAAQTSGYQTPTPIPTFSESEPPPTVPPTTVPPTTVPPNDPEDPSLAATGFAVTTGMAAAVGLVAGGGALVRFARRRRDS